MSDHDEPTRALGQGADKPDHDRGHREITIIVDGDPRQVRRDKWIVSELKAELGIDPAKVLAQITPHGLKDLDDNAKIELHDREQFMTHARSGGSS
ncbi:hypothetical protein [Bradyrhizobium arachidis]|uniref:hypothetical protein n=1 Tax=Bradyrhizobium arachidis TaxID=858423 RepID=UPI0021621ED2|nr:hypothetical protein [Bradyrhizobium arachidis]UVO30333.1 hypothetical protein KUF59_06215 [Bradyrhizobium arachidis]